MPSRKRNVTSIVLKLYEERGTFWMFDCGEGTQQQVLRSPLKMSKLEKLFITHLHGDHLYGLPGLLSSRSYQGGVKPLAIYGPPGIKRYIDTVLELSQARLEYEIEVNEISSGMLFDDGQMKVSTAKLDHRIDSYGFRLEEYEQPGKLLVERLRDELNIPPGPIYASLKRGEDVALADGRSLIAADYVGPSIPGRIVTILGDTRVCDNAKQLARDADVLVHEATFAEDLAELAARYYHSTSREAVQMAKESNVRQLVMTHFSSRYREEDINEWVAELRSIFPNVYAAHDFWEFPILRH